MGAGPVHLTPFFLPASKGKLFCVCFRPADSVGPGRGVLFFPAFAEEMNKSRRIVAQQARALACRGCTVLLVDPFGTGDSEGDFGEADPATWSEDVRYAMGWLQNEGVSGLYFWGMRLGALLALDSARRHAERVDGVWLWQPVAGGKQFLTQFLRLRLAADLMGAGEKITTGSLRESLAAGDAVEVAGYELSPALAAGIDALDLRELLAAYAGRLAWLELLAAEDRPVPVVTRRLLDAVREEGRDIAFRTLVCEPFWSLPELVQAPALIDAGTDLFAEAFPCPE